MTNGKDERREEEEGIRGVLPEITRRHRESEILGNWSQEQSEDVVFMETPDSWLSGMDRFILGVTNSFRNATVYVNITRKPGATVFVARFMTMVNVGDKVFTAPYITGALSVGMSKEQAHREGVIATEAMATELAANVFLATGDAPDGIDPKEIKQFVIVGFGSE